MKIKEIVKKVKIPEGVSFEMNGNIMKISGPKGIIGKKNLEKNIEIKKEGGFVIVRSLKVNKKGKRSAGTLFSIIRNCLRGVQEGYEYKLKICSGHFPMNVSVTGKEIIIKNFLGEKHPRRCVVKGDVEVKLNKEEISIRGIDREVTGQAAAAIEQTTRITNKDRRIFQDGIYITSKPE